METRGCRLGKRDEGMAMLKDGAAKVGRGVAVVRSLYLGSAAKASGVSSKHLQDRPKPKGLAGRRRDVPTASEKNWLITMDGSTDSRMHVNHTPERRGDCGLAIGPARRCLAGRAVVTAQRKTEKSRRAPPPPSRHRGTHPPSCTSSHIHTAPDKKDAIVDDSQPIRRLLMRL